MKSMNHIGGQDMGNLKITIGKEKKTKKQKQKKKQKKKNKKKSRKFM